MTNSQHGTSPTSWDVPADSRTGSMPQRSRHKTASASVEVPPTSVMANELPPSTYSTGDPAAVSKTRIERQSEVVSPTKRRRSANIDLSETIEPHTVLGSSERTRMALSATQSYLVLPTASTERASRSHDLPQDGNWSLPNETILKAAGSRPPNCEDGKHHFGDEFLSRFAIGLDASSTQARTILDTGALPVMCNCDISNIIPGEL
jgi:hypothetical protein